MNIHLCNKAMMSNTYLKTKNIPEQGTGTIDTCTMDPCPMKEKNKSEHVGKCPDCGKTEKVEAV